MDLRITSAWRNSQQAQTIQFIIEDNSGAMRKINLPKSANPALYKFIESPRMIPRSPRASGFHGSPKQPLCRAGLIPASRTA